MTSCKSRCSARNILSQGIYLSHIKKIISTPDSKRVLWRLMDLFSSVNGGQKCRAMRCVPLCGAGIIWLQLISYLSSHPVPHVTAIMMSWLLFSNWLTTGRFLHIPIYTYCTYFNEPFSWPKKTGRGMILLGFWGFWHLLRLVHWTNIKIPLLNKKINLKFDQGENP